MLPSPIKPTVAIAIPSRPTKRHCERSEAISRKPCEIASSLRSSQ
jgi:hypothetical protein